MSARIGGNLSGYYRLHAPIYDWTRPLFLFGRERVVEQLERFTSHDGAPPRRVLEIGCGTGINLAALERKFPKAQLVGIDLAEPMLARARLRLSTKVRLVHGELGKVDLGDPFDVVLASYMLSMTGAQQNACIAAAGAVLAPGGLLAVVDFQSTPSGLFARWMARNHVAFESTLPARLRAAAPEQLLLESHTAYGGVWRYFTSISRRSRLMS